MLSQLQLLVGSFAAGLITTSHSLQAANRAYLMKMQPIVSPIRVTQAHIVVVTTVVGNLDVGIYELRGDQMVPITTAGSTVVGPANTQQVLPLSDGPIWLFPDHVYYAAISADNNTVTFAGWVGETHSAQFVSDLGLTHIYAASFPLPTAPFAVGTTGDYRGVAIWFD